jgi:hypothetical protein
VKVPAKFVAVVAAMVPEPDAARLAPVPTTIAAVVFVAPVMAEKAGADPPGAFPIVFKSQAVPAPFKQAITG